MKNLPVDLIKDQAKGCDEKFKSKHGGELFFVTRNPHKGIGLIR